MLPWNRVRNDLQNKLADELRSNSNSFAGLMAAAAGPDGGMASMQAQNDTLKYTGKWTSKTTEDYIAMVKKELKRQHITVNASMEQKMIDKMIKDKIPKSTGKWTSKTTEDYIAMVKKELKRQHITVNASMEQKMIDKMIKDKIPKSSIDYIIRKAATSTIFYLPQEVAKSPLDHKIDSEAEKRYKPSVWEKNAGIALGSVTDLACMGGLGGGLKTASPLDHKIDSEAEKRYKPSVWEKNAGIALGSVTDLACMGGLGGGLKTAATWIGSDMLVTHVVDKLNDRSDVPMIIAPGKEDEYRRTQQEKKKQAEQKPQNKPQSEEGAQQAEPTEEVNQSEGETNNTQPEQTNMNGWQGLLTSFGLNGISDIGHNLGYVLAMLPDMLVGMFTGKTKSINIKDNMMPIASIVAGMFVKNPILKMVLIGMGGMNLLNKAGHEALDNFKTQDHPQQAGGRVNYRIYPEEPLNARIQNPEIRVRNKLVAESTIASIPKSL